MVMRIESTLRLENDSEKRGEGWWKWSVWVEGSPEDVATVQSVTYRLHPTFPNPVVTVADASTKFKLSLSGWGEFAISADVTLNDGHTTRLERWLELDGITQKDASDDHRPSVFLSYSIADKEIASALRDTLATRGLDVRTAEQSIDFGDDAEVQIDGVLRNTDAIVALFSDPPSRWVEQEALTALRGGTFVVPVMLDDAQVPAKLVTPLRFELTDRSFVAGLADQIAARVKDHVIPEEG
jgi:hypothetical protein